MPDVEKPGNLIYLSHFNAGLRVYDIKDSIQPVESGGSSRPIRPPIPARCRKDVVAQTEDVLVDTRGYIYITDKNWGMWILRYSGPNQPTPTDR